MTNKTATKDDMRGHIESFEIKLNKGSDTPLPRLVSGRGKQSFSYKLLKMTLNLFNEINFL